MPKFTVEHTTKKAADDSFQAIKEFLTKGTEIKKLDANAKCTFDEGKKTAAITGSQFKANLTIEPDGKTSVVKVVVDLPFLLMPFKGKISESLQKMLSKHLS